MVKATISMAQATSAGAAVVPAAQHRTRSLLRRAYDALRFHCVLAVFGIACLAWSLPAALFFWVVPRSRRPAVGQRAIMRGFRMYLWLMWATGLAQFDLSALDALADEGALVIAPNHRSLLDAVLVISRLPRVVCITKASLWDNLFLGGGIRMAAYIRNDAPLKLIRSSIAALAAGQQLLIFPEGTRASSKALGRFKAGFALMAKGAGVPVQTIFIESNTHFLEKGWGLFRQPDFPLVYRAKLGRRFAVEGDLEHFVEDLERYYQEHLSSNAPVL